MFITTIVLFEIAWEFAFDIVPTLIFKPEAPKPPTELLPNGQLNIGGAAAASAAGSLPQIASSLPNLMECTSLGGSLANEDIECKRGDVLFKRFQGVKRLYAGSGNFDLVFRGISSEVQLDNYGSNKVTLDYRTAGINVIGNNRIFIKNKELLAGQFKLRFGSMQDAVMYLPEPEQQPLLTTVGDGCDREWELHGHTNLLVNVDKLGPGCSIVPRGGKATVASLTIDFGYERPATERPCQNTNRVRMYTMGQTTRLEITRADSKEFRYTLPPLFTDFVFKMTNCEDEVELVDTLDSPGAVTIYGGGGIDVITIGNSNTGTDTIFKSVYVHGGDGEDIFTINDSGSPLAKNDVILASTSIAGMLGPISIR